MRVSQRLDYALRAAVLLAGQPPGAWVVAGELADALRLPRRFVEQQVGALARGGVVACRRGPAGGCALTRPAEEITVRDVVAALQGQVLDAPHQSLSATAEMWHNAAVVLGDHLGSITLSELASRQCELDAQCGPMYYI